MHKICDWHLNTLHISKLQAVILRCCTKLVFKLIGSKVMTYRKKRRKKMQNRKNAKDRKNDTLMLETKKIFLTGLWSRGPLKDLKDSKLIPNASNLFPWSSRISLVPFRTFSGPLFPITVTDQELFFIVSYSKPALVSYSSPLKTWQPILPYSGFLLHLLLYDGNIIRTNVAWKNRSIPLRSAKKILGIDPSNHQYLLKIE